MRGPTALTPTMTSRTSPRCGCCLKPSTVTKTVSGLLSSTDHDLIEYFVTASAGSAGEREDWDPFAEAAAVIDPSQWYTTSFDAAPDRSVTRWLPPDGSGLATVAVYSQAGATTVLIRYHHGGPSTHCS